MKQIFLLGLACSVIAPGLAVASAASPANTRKPAVEAHPGLPPPPRPEPFSVTTIPLPANVLSAVLVNYLPDGEHLVMEVRMAGSTKTDLAVVKDDGSGFKCLTLGLVENIGGEMPVPLPDGKRVYTPTGILECSPSILDCQQARVLPLVYPQMKGAPTTARLATNLSPDGIHVAYTIATTQGVYVLVSELTRVSEDDNVRYELTNTRVVGGLGRQGNDMGSLKEISFGGEVKSFAGQGRYLTAISIYESSNFDITRLDLATGHVARLTRHFSWDEGVYPSPDCQWIVVQTHRHINRMDAFGLIPRPRIAGADLGYGVGFYRNEVVNPAKLRRRFYGLVLLDQFGDRARLPEDGYTGQILTTDDDNLTEFNHFGNFTWHPTGTRGVFWEQKDHLKTKPGEMEGRLRMIRFTSRLPTKPQAPYAPDLSWATKLEDAAPAPSRFPDNGRLPGDISGHAVFVTERHLAGEKETRILKITYVDYSDDTDYVLSGTESIANDGSAMPEILWNADIAVTGKRNGFLKVENAVLHPWSVGSGIIRTQLGNRKIEVDLARGLPTGVPGELK